MARHIQTSAGRIAGRLAAAAVMTAVMSAGAAPAWSQVKAGSETGLGLTGAEIPQLLQDIKAEPYKPPVAPACDTVPAEIQAINDLIGADMDAVVEPDATADAKSAVMKSGAAMVRGLVPYGGVVRFVTGANKKDAALREAVFAAYARRGFLRGVELNLKCRSTAVAAATPPDAPERPKSKRHR